MNFQGAYPDTRLRRLRRAPFLRHLVQETRLHVHDLVWPVFVEEGEGRETAIAGLPGVTRYSVDRAAEECAKAYALGIQAVALFPATDPADKTDDAREALNPENLVCRAIRAIKARVPGLGIIADVALDPYTTHGHDGLLDASGDVENDRTVEMLCAQAVLLAQAGADIVAPSDMMDGRVRAIRRALDAQMFSQVAILSYAAKYASAFYGPFRAAVGSQSALGKADKRSYQMNPANADEAVREVALDVAEGADMVMVKPGILYLDVLHRVAQACNLPVAAYHVSGEYAMLKTAAEAGMLEYEASLMETLLAFKRAGAAFILTYGAREAASYLTE
jgi:porphobilinogen synthase